MRDGCAGNFTSGMDIINKLRTMGFGAEPMPLALTIQCENCQASFQMATFESQCPDCGMVYGVTPCHAHDAAAVLAAGIGV